MNDVSPFLIGKHLQDHVGELKNLKLQNDGSYHVETTNEKQVTSLLKLAKLEANLNVKITEHPTRNFSKNTFTSYELKGLKDDEILTELQKTYKSIVKIKRFIKKVEGNEVPTNSFLVTYSVSKNCPYTPVRKQFSM